MSQYINREDLYEQLRLSANRSTLGETTPSELTAKEILSVIADMPPSDVVEVVRCKDCGYCKTECEAEHGRTQHYCKKNGIFEILVVHLGDSLVGVYGVSVAGKSSYFNAVLIDSRLELIELRPVGKQLGRIAVSLSGISARTYLNSLNAE